MLTPLQRRYALFLGGCIPMRLALAWAAYAIPLRWLPWFAWIPLVIGLGFMYLYVTGQRQTGLETGGAPIWWRPYRWIHGFNYLLAALLAFHQRRVASLVLLWDTLYGLGLFLIHHRFV